MQVARTADESAFSATALDERARVAGQERMLIRSATAEVEVSDLAAAAGEAKAAAQSAEGFLESSSETAETSVHLRFRIPAPHLDTFLATLGSLGELERLSVRSEDVSEWHADLAARQATDLALRERLRELLARAESVEEVLAVEKELARLQAEIETRQAQLDRIESQVALSSVALTLRRKTRLGPVGWAGYAFFWAFEKLFVLD
jgi:hypothetical protein